MYSPLIRVVKMLNQLLKTFWHNKLACLKVKKAYVLVESVQVEQSYDLIGPHPGDLYYTSITDS